MVRSEQNGAHEASGFARASGKAGVCIATSGPGATNLITGLATAYMDSIPLVAITGQVNSELLGRDVFQEADVTGACDQAEVKVGLFDIVGIFFGTVAGAPHISDDITGLDSAAFF